MDENTPTLRDELLYGQVKGDKTVHLFTAILYAATTLGAIGIAIAALALHKGSGPALAVAGMGVGAFVCAGGEWRRYRAYVAALAEIGDSPAGIDTCRTYSKATAQILAGSRKSADVLRQLWIAYGIVAIMLIAAMALFIVLSFGADFGDDGMLFYGCAAIMGIMGFPLLTQAIRCFREWTVTRKLEKLG